MLFIKITDNGPGIPSNLLEDIFIPFLQLKRMEQVLGLAYLNKLYVCMVVNYL